MIKIALLVITAAVGVVLAYAATKPDSYNVSRSQVINAPVEQLYAIINTPREFERWSPYQARYPQLKNTYSGPASGVGARVEFAGNNQVGEGTVEIVGSTAPSEVKMRLTMVRPFSALNDVTYSIRPDAGGTEVTWAMHAKAPFFLKVMSVFMNMDKMIGGDFADGLVRLKALAEKG